ncbi:DnaD domain protein [Kurthia huakuii]|uniref:DnaD domain protein n=1 Tax=Kurthia huakuii TaxID=1421019 RepID=UPI0004957DEB|nr:DnaD domain protein [Kurthia huakuii]MBM7698661.1 DnaD/phage-associated family protein [Kurthia huakuii]
MAEQNEIQGVQHEGILEKGYGLIPQLLTRDKSLSIEAKAIYAYLAAFAGTTQKAFPGVKLICDELNISENRYLKHRKQLLDRGYIEIKRKRLENGFSKNIYSLKQSIPVHLQNVGIGNVGIGNVGIGNEGTKSNIFKSNISKSNSIQKQQLQKEDRSSLSSQIFKFYENEFGPLSPYISEEIDYMIKESNEELVLEALKISVLANKRTIKYAAAIVRNWNNENIKTVSDLKANENKKGRERNESNSASYEPTKKYDDGVNF